MEKLYPLIFVDVALFTIVKNALCVLLVKRLNEPECGRWALPGGILKPDIDVTVEDAAQRVLKTKVGFTAPYLEQVSVLSGPKRDSRGYSLSVLHTALLPKDQAPAVVGAKTKAVAWHDAGTVRKLAFDHYSMVTLSTKRLREKVAQRKLPLHLLPEAFTLSQLQKVCEAVLGYALDKSSFRRRMKEESSLVEIEGALQWGPNRPAQLYRARDDFRF